MDPCSATKILKLEYLRPYSMMPFESILNEDE